MQSEVDRLRNKFQESRAELLRVDPAAIPCLEFLARHTALVDEVVSDIYTYSCRFADHKAKPTENSGLALVATGGYGRGELNPFSDIDIAFIPSEEEDRWVEAAVHMAFKLVMDVFLSFREVRVGYSYRPVAELPTWDLPTLTALLDARHICGSAWVSESLVLALRKRLSPLDLLLELESEEEKRKSASGPPSLYSVEPNLKEGPGSLRDLHRGRWIFKLLVPAVDHSPLLPTLEKQNYLPASRIAEVQRAAEWFWRARTWLHLIARKRSDILINNYQDRIARDLLGVTAQEWLSEHYAHAEILHYFCETAVRTALKGPLDLGGVTLEGGFLHVSQKDEKPFPGSGVRVIQLSQKYGIPVSFKQIEDLQDSRPAALAVDRTGPEESWSFLGILGAGRRVAQALRSLADAGLVDRFIDGFTPLMRYAPPDPAHSYTVGEHSLKIIEHLEDLRHGRDASGVRFCELIGQCAHFDMLCLAALLHDAGKMLPGTDHSESGVDLTRRVAARLELPQEKREILEILVRHHLLLVRTARLQDLKSPGVIQEVADKVRNIDALRHLYVFTYADTRAVAEKNWTSMDYRDLEELYAKVQNLISEPRPESISSMAIEDRIGQIRRRLASTRPQEDEAVQRHCDSMPASYVLNTPLDEIVFHIQLLERLGSERIVLDIYNRPGDDYSELTVCTHDDPQPGMLAKITGVLYACDSDIHKAQVFTLEKAQPVVLDTLWVRSGGMPLSENRAARVRAGLKEVLSGSRSVDQFLKRAGKSTPESIVLDSVDLRNDLSEEHTIVHIIARDLQGLLYHMTRTLSRSGLHIHSARVATWNARAENNFYVTTLSGGQIPTAELGRWREQLKIMFRGTIAG
jgi:[protein-PII] uridylyltransferase